MKASPILLEFQITKEMLKIAFKIKKGLNTIKCQTLIQKE